jgi:predicted acyl esterase
MLIAGNPVAFLRITSDRPGGQVDVHLFDVPPNLRCGGNGGGGSGNGAKRWGAGVADLRFHRGNFMGKDFPTNVPVDVRVDITDFAEILDTGHRLGITVSYGDEIDRTSQPWAPTISVAGDASHLVLPIVNGTFGGSPPTLAYPPRPFTPPEYHVP